MIKRISIFHFLPVLVAGMIILACNKQLQDTSQMRQIGHMQENFTSEWSAIDSLEKEGLLKDALARLDDLKKDIDRKGDPPQQIKYLVYYNKIQSRLEEDAYVKVIERFENALQDFKGADKAIVHSMTAELYASYTMRNMYELRERTNMPDEAGDDIRNWGVLQLITKINQHYFASIKEETRTLKADLYSDVLTEKSWADTLRPSMYDLLAHRAIDYFSQDYGYLVDPPNTFSLNHPKFLAGYQDFASIDLKHPDTSSFAFKTIVLFQDLLAFRANTDNVAALIDADLKRLRFVYERTSFDERDSLYLTRLDELAEFIQGSPQEAEILFLKANYYFQKGNQYQAGDPTTHPYRWDLKQAYTICQDAISIDSSSFGASHCRRIADQITAKNNEIQVEEVNLPEAAILAYLNYKNSSEANFRLVHLTNNVNEQKASSNQKDLIKRYLGITPLRSWSQNLPDEGDFQSHSVEFSLGSLNPGRYAVLTSADNSWNPDNAMAFIEFQVSNLAFFQSKAQETSGDFIIVDRHSGKPLEGVNVEFYSAGYVPNRREYQFQLIDRKQSNYEGKVSINTNRQQEARNLSLRLISGTDTLFHQEGFNQYVYDRGNRSFERCYLFLDRSIYRPGQEVYFKGYLLEFDRDGIPSILTGKNIKVALHDANGQKRAELDLKSNAFGTISGSFRAPDTGLRGMMTLRTNRGNTSQHFRVEEYKRPTFEVNIEDVNEAIRLGDSVKISGKAMSYAGSAIGNATLRYRVVREVYYPYFPWWLGRWPVSGNTQEIAHGSLRTGDDGTYTFTFQAKEDENAIEKHNPIFNFTTTVDVVDITGETRSAAKDISVSHKGFQAYVNLPEKISIDALKELQVRVSNQNGDLVESGASLVVSRLVGPDRPQRKRYWNVPDYRLLSDEEYREQFPHYAVPGEEGMENWDVLAITDPASYQVDGIDTIDLSGQITLQGNYKLDWLFRSGDDTLRLIQYTTVYNPRESLPSHLLYFSETQKSSWQPGEQVPVNQQASSQGLWIFNVVERKSGIRDEWIQIAGPNEYTLTVEESDRGGFAYHDVYIFDNRFYQQSQRIEVPWSNKHLTIEWMSYRDNTLPGAEEEWRLKIKGPKSDVVMAEFLGSMYDASLDAISPHDWAFQPYPHFGQSWFARQVGFHATVSRWFNYRWDATHSENIIKNYRDINWFGFRFGGIFYNRYDKETRQSAGHAMEETELAPPNTGEPVDHTSANLTDDSSQEPPSGETKREGVTSVQPPVRKNLDETVFFFPHLQTDREGNVTLKFKMNEALTRWKFQGFAHTKGLQFALTEQTIVTQKDLMVFPNAPRFLRQGDKMALPVKVSSLAEKQLNGSLECRILDAATGKDVSAQFNLDSRPVDFTLQPGLSTFHNYTLEVPEDWTMPVNYQVIARAGSHADGQEALLPVLSNRILITETMPMTVKAGEEKEFVFEALSENASTTLDHHAFTLEFTPNPAWYVVQALPYLMEYPHECSEQVFSRIYANMLGAHIIDQLPAIKEVFNQWKGSSEGLISNLNKNQELKSALLEETPWVMDAMTEEEQMHRIALLFDMHRMQDELEKGIGKLSALQLSNGGWPWFHGGPDNWYITQYILEGFGHLQELGVLDLAKFQGLKPMITNALQYTDARITESYNKLQELAREEKIKLEDDHLSSIAIHYLYARTFFNDVPVEKSANEAIRYFTGQAEKYWTDRNLYEQGLIALSTHRSGNEELAQRIGRSIDQRSLFSEELGRYWKVEAGYYWYQLPIERHSLMVELYHELGFPVEKVDELRLWLLRNKQTNRWKTTKATAAAVYAFLLQGTNWLEQDKPVEIKIGDEFISADSGTGQAGTAWIKQQWEGDEVSADFARVHIENPNDHMAWGAAYWQYFEDMDKVISQEGDALQIRKILSVEQMTDHGPVLISVEKAKSIKQGDKVVVRIEIEIDRPMEFVHLKDQRAAGMEPVEQVSSYRWKGGLGYYQSTGDLGTDFFIDYLPRGHYVLEYALIAQQPGVFSNGIGTLQCMYAPEFSGHTAGSKVTIE